MSYNSTNVEEIPTNIDNKISKLYKNNIGIYFI